MFICSFRIPCKQGRSRPGTTCANIKSSDNSYSSNLTNDQM